MKVLLLVLAGVGLALLPFWQPEAAAGLGRVLPAGMALAGALGAWRRGWRALALELTVVGLTLAVAPAAGRWAGEAAWRAWGVSWAALGASFAAGFGASGALRLLTRWLGAGGPPGA